MSREEGIAREVAALGGLARAELAARWTKAFGAPPASDVPPALMRKALAWEIQARAFGGHAKRTLRALVAAAGGKPASASPRAGTRLVREWNGVVHEVEALQDGWRWRGETWSSLSAIAKAITGAKWSGPRFFGLTGRR